MDSKISNELYHIASSIQYNGGKLLIVGGFIRNHFLGLPSKDVDLEVYNLDFNQLKTILSPFGDVNIVGASYQVLKLTTQNDDYDFALPRTEEKNGVGYKGFDVQAHPTLDYKTAFKRRDFTVNAIGYDIAEGVFIDVFGGLKDIQDKTLRHTSECFADDPTRVIRGMRFHATLDFAIPKKTLELCRTLIGEFETIPKDRIWGEFIKVLLYAKKPSKAFEFLRNCGWITKFSELDTLQGVQQEKEWHPEGDVWIHTMHVLDAAATIAKRECLDKRSTIILLLSALCHDLGKPRTTVQKEKNGVLRWTAPQHDKAGVKPTLELLEKMGVPKSIHKEICTLVAEHMTHINEMGIGGVRRLINRLADGGTNLKMLSMVVEADLSGRPPLIGHLPMCFERFFEIERLEPIQPTGKIKAIVNGDFLKSVGFTEGVELGRKYKQLYELQLDGAFKNISEALKFIG